MTELEKYELINSSETIEQLKEAIIKIGDIQISNGNIWSSEKMNLRIDSVINGQPYNMVTRNYGIRKQLLYLNHYGEF